MYNYAYHLSDYFLYSWLTICGRKPVRIYVQTDCMLRTYILIIMYKFSVFKIFEGKRW